MTTELTYMVNKYFRRVQKRITWIWSTLAPTKFCQVLHTKADQLDLIRFALCIARLWGQEKVNWSQLIRFYTLTLGISSQFKN